VTRVAAIVVLLALMRAVLWASGTLDIYFIDVEGGQSTLIVTPSRESVLVDAGYGGRGGRDPDRIMAAVRDAGLARIDYLIATHLHNDHIGGIPELLERVPVGTFVDYGAPLGTDRMASNGFRTYEPIRDAHPHLQPEPGARLPLSGLDVTVVSTGGQLLAMPLRGGGGVNPACVDVEDHVEDGTENYRSVGVMVEFGAFRFLDVGDLSGNTLTGMACPMDRLGPVSAYLIAHHGDYDSNVPALYAALRPRVAIMNNGQRKGGSADAFRTLRTLTGTDLWQLHWSPLPNAANAPDERIANLDDDAAGFAIKLVARGDGSFSVTNARNGFSKAYGPLVTSQLQAAAAPRP
jgi:beta-lactamase superfamily II metal-dependent hydrolase